MTHTPVVPEQIDLEVEAIIAQVSGYMTSVDPLVIRHEIWRAYEFARDAHSGQVRKSGDPYILHPVMATKLLLILKPDIVTIQCCLLHDVPEDTDRNIDQIRRVFGPTVAHIVGGMEKLTKVKYHGEERSIGSLRKMFVAMSDDIRLIFVKLADRAHNMQTLHHHPTPEKRRRIALETLNIYAPIADRLGIFEFKEILETECFRELYPEEYTSICAQLSEMTDDQEMFTRYVETLIREAIPPHIPVYEVSSRIKSPYSIYKKMQRKGYSRVKDIYDLFAVRIITDTDHHCYDIFGYIHLTWTPVPKRFKDYISLPKENGYKSIHTTVVGIFQKLRQQPTEIQIRTREMHRHAEIGIAAHFEYSEAGGSTHARDVEWVKELKQIIAGSQESEFMENMQMHIFDDRIFVFTPKGEVKNLPVGSTPVDFAYAIHSDLGDHLAIAKINGKISPLDSELKNGDRVEIITDANKRPNISWLSFVKTARAREVIKAFVNREQRGDLIEKGKFLLNSYLDKNFGIQLDKDLSILARLDDHFLTTRDREDILVQIGNLSRKPSSLSHTIGALSRIVHPPKSKKSTPKKTSQKAESISPTGPRLFIAGQLGLPHALALCCRPHTGDRVIGYLARGAIRIHQVSCPSLRKANLDKLLPCRWEGSMPEPLKIEGEMLFESDSRALRFFIEAVYHLRITIENMQHVHSEEGEKIHFTLVSRDDDYDVYDRLVNHISIQIPSYRSATLVRMV